MNAVDYAVVGLILAVIIVGLIVHFNGQKLTLASFEKEAEDIYAKLSAKFREELAQRTKPAEPIPMPKPGLPPGPNTAQAPVAAPPLTPAPLAPSTALFAGGNATGVVVANATVADPVDRNSRVLVKPASGTGGDWLNIPIGATPYIVKDVKAGEECRFQVGGGYLPISFSVFDPDGHIVFGYRADAGAGSMLGFVPTMDGDYALNMNAESTGTINHWRGN